MNQPTQELDQAAEHEPFSADDLAALSTTTLALLDTHAQRDDLAWPHANSARLW